jgi:hypothetical protein
MILAWAPLGLQRGQLFTALQAWIVQLLVERLDLLDDALEVRIRAEGRASLVGELRQQGESHAPVHRMLARVLHPERLSLQNRRSTQEQGWEQQSSILSASQCCWIGYGIQADGTEAVGLEESQNGCAACF